MMAEYISRESVLHVIQRYFPDYYKSLSAYLDIERLPVADAAPVVHGKWEYVDVTINTMSQLRCSICGWWTLDLSVNGVYHYCPNCGARMDGGNENA